MGRSIIQEGKQCYFCGRVTGLEKHHIFAGHANRPISEKEGLWCWLCHEHHTGTDGAQYDKMKNLQLKQDAQFAYERTHSRNDWMRLIGKNYL